MDWQPIETAEKVPGMRVLLCDMDDRWVYVGLWMEGVGDDGLWMDDEGFSPDYQPTHWMPLPTPPKETLEP